MSEQHEDPRLRALLLAARNQLDTLWRVSDRAANDGHQSVEGVLKLIGAIDYALGIEQYTFDIDANANDKKAASSTPLAQTPARPIASNGNHGLSHPLDVNGGN
jgi:hypothetical protein